jgi:hypothetical protein
MRKLIVSTLRTLGTDHLLEAAQAPGARRFVAYPLLGQRSHPPLGTWPSMNAVGGL